MTQEPPGGRALGRPGDHELDDLLASLEIANVQLAEYAVRPAGRAGFPAIDAPSLYYVRAGRGCLVIGDGETRPLHAHTLVLAPPDLTLSFEGALSDLSSRVPGSDAGDEPASPAHIAGLEDNGLVVIGGRIDVAFGDHVGLFAHLDAPIAETFEASDRLGERLHDALDELAAGRAASGAMAQALLVQVIIILLRRCLVSMNPFGARLTAAFPHFRRRMD
jgi:hypothetical protein